MPKDFIHRTIHEWIFAKASRLSDLLHELARQETDPLKSQKLRKQADFSAEVAKNSWEAMHSHD